METLTMSRKERDRLTVMAGVTRQELTLVQAAAVMDLGYRQSKRVWRRYQTEGDAGLVHRLRGKPSGRRKPPALRAQVLARYAEERSADFGPTLMAEHLAQETGVTGADTIVACAVQIPPSSGDGPDSTTATSFVPSADEATDCHSSLGALVCVHVAPESVEV
jgi:hypothetical protein